MSSTTSADQQSQRSAAVEDCFPGSVEEAAALLGATITMASGSRSKEAVLPPTGMHPAFAIVAQPSLTSELVSRLYVLRALLRTVQSRHSASGPAKGPALPAAPSILQLLKKMLGISTQLGATTTAQTTEVPRKKKKEGVLLLTHKHAAPPLHSTPCRRLWVDCVVLCHALSGNAGGGELTQFVRQMLALATTHPRSAKAAGGVRIAALEVVAALMEHGDGNDAVNNNNNKKFPLASQLAPWSLDALQVCLGGPPSPNYF